MAPSGSRKSPLREVVDRRETADGQLERLACGHRYLNADRASFADTRRRCDDCRALGQPDAPLKEALRRARRRIKRLKERLAALEDAGA